MGYNTGDFLPQIKSVDEILEFDESGLPESIQLEKNIKATDNLNISLSFHAEFDSLNATIFASCYDPSEGFKDIVDGFSYKINDNFGYIRFMQLTKEAERIISNKSSEEIIEIGNKLFSNLK